MNLSSFHCHYMHFQYIQVSSVNKKNLLLTEVDLLDVLLNTLCWVSWCTTELFESISTSDVSTFPFRWQFLIYLLFVLYIFNWFIFFCIYNCFYSLKDPRWVALNGINLSWISLSKPVYFYCLELDVLSFYIYNIFVISYKLWSIWIVFVQIWSCS